MRPKSVLFTILVAAAWLTPCTTFAQISFDKSGYYLAIGDSVSAGEGALPVTQGFVYRLYEQGVFGRIQEMDFANIAMRGAFSDEVQAFQVPQALCIQPPRIAARPSVITLTAGANDFFALLGSLNPNDPPPSPGQIAAVANGIADKVAGIVQSLVFGIPGSQIACLQSGIPGVRVMVGNYYKLDHPDPDHPEIDQLLNFALDTFSARLQADIAQIQAAIQGAGMTARVAFVDTLAAMSGREGLLLIDKRNGFNGGLDFEIHPTNAGYQVMAKEFQKVWQTIQ